MMHVILEVLSGDQIGLKRMLQEHQVLEVGRSALTDFSFEHDRKMSSRHFRIVTTRTTCQIADLHSSNGTEVNGQKIARQDLRDNDIILAGETRFVAHVEGAIEGTSVKRGDTVPAAAQVENSGSPTFTIEVCKSGLKLFRGPTEDMPPSILAQRLGQRFQQLLIVCPELLEAARREDLGEPEYLFNWLPEETRVNQSPLIITDAGVAERADIVTAAWGKDGLVGVYFEKDEALPLEQLQRCAGTYVKPSVLRPQFSETAACVAEDLLLEIEIVLVEDEAGDSWLLYSTHDLQPLLADFGLKRMELADADKARKSKILA